ncbi:MAG: ABC transporter permease [Planctomycetota bacterium]
MTQSHSANPGTASHTLAPTSEAAPAERFYSKDYWDLVFEQLGRRKLFKVALAILTALYGVAAFAPLLVNDKPYMVESVDTTAYTSAVRTLRVTISSSNRLAKQTDEAYAASVADKPAAEPTRGGAFAVELGAARLRLATLRSALPPDKYAPLDEIEALLDQGEAKLTADGPAAVEALTTATALARQLGKDYAAWDPAQPDTAGVDLVGQREHPLWESLKSWEIFFMTLWLLTAAWPLWNRVVNGLVLRRDRERIRRARRWKLLGVLALSLVATFVWRAQLGSGRSGLDVAPHKEGLAKGTIHLVAEGRTLREAQTDPTAVGRIEWAPVRYGYAESTVVEKFRPPTWRAEGEIDPATGRLVHPKWALDAETIGDRAVGQPMVIRPGEPEANAWNRHIAGTDELGRDFFGRMIWGSRVSLSVGIVSALILTVIGVIIGSIAGFFGGWIDTLIMRMIEILQSIPSFFLILLAMAFTNPEVLPPIFAIVLVIGCIGWTGVARLVRGEFLRLREQEFVVAARALGFSNARTIFRHVLPNALSPVLVAAAFAVASGILIESAISFLGFGVQQPEASWGSLVNETRNTSYWWIQVFPGVLIFVTVTCYNLVGDAVRDALDPKMKV